MLNTISSKLPFEWAAGSIVGHLHLGQTGLLRGQDNQDALVVRSTPQGIISVVCDGCGSEPHSAVGSRVGAMLLVSNVQRSLQRGALTDNPQRTQAFWERVRHDTLAQLRVLALSMAGEGSFTEVIREHFLFTALVAVVSAEWTQVVAIGDGFTALNGSVQRRGPFANNMPPYLAYELIETEFSARRAELAFQLVHVLPTDLLESMMLASDGLEEVIAAELRSLPGQAQAFGPLRQFWEQDSYFRNRDAIRRRLALANSERTVLDRTAGSLVVHRPLLSDDTTLVVIRRIKEEV